MTTNTAGKAAEPEVTPEPVKPTLPQPPEHLVQIGNARREKTLRELRLRLSRGQRDYTQRSEQSRLSGYGDPAGMLTMSAQANKETERVIAELEGLSGRAVVLRFVPESPESEWANRRPPMF